MNRPLKHITVLDRAYLVRVIRGDVTLRAAVPFSFPGDALAEALRWRDKFVAQLGPRPPRRQTIARSNTGVIGVSETTAWYRSNQVACFHAYHWRAGRQQSKRFLYRTASQRETAFAAAIQFRQAAERLASKEPHA